MYNFTSNFLISIFFFFMSGISNVTAQNKELEITPEIFGQLPFFSNVKISPDGTRLATFRQVNGLKTLYTFSFRKEDEGNNRYITSYPQGEIGWFNWLSNDRLAVSYRFAANRGGFVDTVETRLMAMDWDRKNDVNLGQKKKFTSSASEVYAPVSQDQDNVISFLDDDPDHILMSISSATNLSYDVLKVDINNGRSQRKIKGYSNIQTWRADKKGNLRFAISYERNSTEFLYRKDEDSNWISLLKYNPFTEDAPFLFEDFSNQENIIYVSKLTENRKMAFYSYDVDKAEFLTEIASDDNVDIEKIDLDENGNLISYTYSDEISRTIFKDKFWKEIFQILEVTFPNQRVIIESYSKDKKKFIIKVTSPQNPGTHYLFDLDSRTIAWIADEYPDLDKSKLSEMKIISYEARDGLKIPGYLSLPKGGENKNLPTIILPHGGPFSRDYWGFDYVVQFLTSRGFAVLQMNFRGSQGYGQDFEELGYHEWGGKMLDDINDGTRWLISQGTADPNRICIIGASYGGYAALQASIKENDLYKCSVAFAPVTDMDYLIRTEKRYANWKRRLRYVVSEEHSNDEISPIENIDKINFPVLLMHGTIDRVVPYKQGEMFADKMKDKNKNIKFVTFENGDHYLSRQQHRVEYLQEIEKFLNQNLK